MRPVLRAQTLRKTKVIIRNLAPGQSRGRGVDGELQMVQQHLLHEIHAFRWSVICVASDRSSKKQQTAACSVTTRSAPTHHPLTASQVAILAAREGERVGLDCYEVQLVSETT